MDQLVWSQAAISFRGTAQRRLVLLDLGEAADRVEKVIVALVIVDLADLADEHPPRARSP